jgi:hypothetical protein
MSRENGRMIAMARMMRTIDGAEGAEAASW